MGFVAVFWLGALVFVFMGCFLCEIFAGVV